MKILALAGLISAIGCGAARAGNDGNFVLYNQHMSEKGETEIEIQSDFADVGNTEANYTAQLMEIEYGVTDFWTTALYLEGVKSANDDYGFGSFRLENRARLFSHDTFFNPVIYAEYEQKTPDSRFITSVVGRTDHEEGPPATEHELETKLILGRDLSDRLTLAFDWINELKFDNGLWSFGYAAGLNYVLFKDDAEGASTERASSFDLEKITLGVEFYGGLGDSELGLTIDPEKTEQYAGLNLEAEFENHVHFGIGGALGLTGPSEEARLRLAAGYEF